MRMLLFVLVLAQNYGNPWGGWGSTYPQAPQPFAPQGTIANPYIFQQPDGQRFRVWAMPSYGGLPPGSYGNPYRIQPR